MQYGQTKMLNKTAKKEPTKIWPTGTEFGGRPSEYLCRKRLCYTVE